MDTRKPNIMDTKKTMKFLQEENPNECV